MHLFFSKDSSFNLYIFQVPTITTIPRLPALVKKMTTRRPLSSTTKASSRTMRTTWTAWTGSDLWSRRRQKPTKSQVWSPSIRLEISASTTCRLAVRLKSIIEMHVGHSSENPWSWLCSWKRPGTRRTC